MTDYPMIYSAPMVRALQAGIKTQTRRLSGLDDVNKNPGAWSLHSVGPLEYMAKPSVKGRFGATFESRDIEPGTLYVCPQVSPCAPGDRLWVKEAWRFDAAWDGFKPSEMHAGDAICYEADWAHDVRAWDVRAWGHPFTPGRYRSARFCPRWASRITLTVTDVRPQRLQDISEADSVAEGATAREKCSGLLRRETGWSMDWSEVGQLSAYAFRPPGGPAKTPLKESDISLGDPKMAFASYFNSIHGPDAWARNDWVWAYSFSVHHGNIDSMERRG